MCTRPDITPVTDFILAYNHHPSSNHLKAALYALLYAHSTPELGIKLSYTSDKEHHTQIYHPSHHAREAYIDALAPTTTTQKKIMG